MVMVRYVDNQLHHFMVLLHHYLKLFGYSTTPAEWIINRCSLSDPSKENDHVQSLLYEFRVSVVDRDVLTSLLIGYC